MTDTNLYEFGPKLEGLGRLTRVSATIFDATVLDDPRYTGKPQIGSDVARQWAAPK